MGDNLLVFADAAGVPRSWRLLSGGAVVGRGDQVAELPETRPWVRVVLAVPGTDVALHWLELSEGLTPVQAAAAARLQMTEETAEPIGSLHVAAGRPERGLTPVALAPAEQMRAWIESARALALEPDLILPAPLLLMPPGDGLVRYDGGVVPDYRGLARAFSAEDELAALIAGDAPITDVDDDGRDAVLAQVLADPPINLRQGAFARRREWAINWALARRLAVYALLLLLASVAIQLVTIVRTTFAADRYAAEAAEMRRATGRPGRGAQAATRYGPAAGALFAALRDTPNVQLAQLVWQPDGTLRASILADVPASVDMLRARIEQNGMQARGDMPTQVAGRTASQIMIRSR